MVKFVTDCLSSTGMLHDGGAAGSAACATDAADVMNPVPGSMFLLVNVATCFLVDLSLCLCRRRRASDQYAVAVILAVQQGKPARVPHQERAHVPRQR